MAAQPVEWVLVIFYGPSAHRATYGRLEGTKYTKDYIQLSRTAEFLSTVANLFQVTAGDDTSVPLTYLWPNGTAPGTLVFRSADRPHLKWETRSGAPKAWKMAPTPNESSAETIPGNPNHTDFDSAEKELELLALTGVGQPYLMAIKLRDEPRTLHLRTYLAKPGKEYAWADIKTAPQSIEALVAQTSQQSALAWSSFQSGGTIPSPNTKAILAQLLAANDPAPVINGLNEDVNHILANYLRGPGYGLFFDPSRNHDAWVLPDVLPRPIAESADALLALLEARYPTPQQGDAIAEIMEVSQEEVEAFRTKIEEKNYGVPDTYATVKTRGSAQKAFADVVKSNYGFRCAVTGITTRHFLVASHIVPWSQDQSLRLDPANGICLSLLVDCAFERGYLAIEDDLTIRIVWEKIKDDIQLRNQLAPYDRQKLSPATKEGPKPEYLQRRRALLIPDK